MSAEAQDLVPPINHAPASAAGMYLTYMPSVDNKLVYAEPLHSESLY